MEQASSAAGSSLTGRLFEPGRPIEALPVHPAWLGLAVGLSWLTIVALAYGIAHIAIGPARLTMSVMPFAWTVLVNATLVGIIVGGHAHLHRMARADLASLRPLLPDDDASFERLLVDIPNLAPSTRRLLTLCGVIGGVAVATLDPNLRDVNRYFSSTDPRYLVFLGQNVLFGVLGTRLFAAEIHLTRGYTRLGERVRIDLFEPSTLLVFARKGLRSVVVWVLVSSTFSMFWVLDSAGQTNVLFPVGVLVLVTAALVAPTRGVHLGIVAAKQAEQTRVAEAIRVESARTLAERDPAAPPEDARLGNLIQYQEYVRSIREWPFDLSIVARSILLIVLGAGSWLGGAIVERLLEVVLD